VNVAMTIDVLPQLALPRYRRTGQAFQDLLGATAVDVLASMDAAGDDVPNQTPRDDIELDGVGIRRRDVIVSIEDPFGGSGRVNAICTVDIAASVPGTRRGVHLSRIGQAVAESVATPHRDLSAYARTLAKAVADSQYGGAKVSVHGRIPYLEDVQADESGRRKLSLEHLEAIARHACRSGSITNDIGLRVTHLVACPCVQHTYRHATMLRYGPTCDATLGGAIPLMTHSQRCITTVMVQGVTEGRSLIDMLTRLDDVLLRTCNTLPRDAELSLVYRAHRTPQFIEDALRAAAHAVAGLWPSRASFRRVVGRSRSLESIHGHDLTASLTLNGVNGHARDRV
jgi:GTP cyclohydrolase FolE2